MYLLKIIQNEKEEIELEVLEKRKELKELEIKIENLKDYIFKGDQIISDCNKFINDNTASQSISKAKR